MQLARIYEGLIVIVDISDKGTNKLPTLARFANSGSFTLHAASFGSEKGVIAL
jgi:hypothetical protein